MEVLEEPGLTLRSRAYESDGPVTFRKALGSTARNQAAAPSLFRQMDSNHLHSGASLARILKSYLRCKARESA